MGGMFDNYQSDANEPERPEWCPEWMPSKTSLDYIAVIGTVIALSVLIGLGTGVIKGSHFKRLGFSGIGGAGT
jgi:hypothetical protein